MIKRIILIIAIIFLTIAPAFGASFLLESVKVAGSGTIFVITPSPNHAYQVNVVDADKSITVITVALEGSLDGASWFTIDGSEHTFDATELAALMCLRHVIDRPVEYVRGKIVTLTGADGTNDTVTMSYTNGRFPR